MKLSISVVRPLLLCAALLACAAASRPLAAQEPDTAAAVTGAIYEIRLTDGSVIYGRVTEQSGTDVTVRTEAGALVRLQRGQIARMTVAEGRVVGGRVWPADPNATRLFFGPTARAVGAGRGYLGVYEIFFPFVTVGVTDNITLSGGTPIIPEVIGEVWYVAPKITVVQTERMALAAGVLAAGFDGETAGIVYGVGTFGSPDQAVTAGAGWGFANGDLNNQPVVMLGGERRVGPSVKLITENYFLVGEGDAGVSGGVRFFGERLSADLGIAVDAVGGGWIPLVNFVYSF
jgi:hypothetical protein